MAAIIGAAGLAIGWAVLELGFGGILNPAKEEPKPPKDPAVILVEEVANEAKKEMIMKEFPDTRTQSQIEEDEIVEALDEGTIHDINKQRREHEHSRR